MTNDALTLAERRTLDDLLKRPCARCRENPHVSDTRWLVELADRAGWLMFCRRCFPHAQRLADHVIAGAWKVSPAYHRQSYCEPPER